MYVVILAGVRSSQVGRHDETSTGYAGDPLCEPCHRYFHQGSGMHQVPYSTLYLAIHCVYCCGIVPAIKFGQNTL